MNSEELELIEEYAGKLMTVEEIAILLDKDYGELTEQISDKKSEQYNAYKKGKTKRKLTIMSNIIKYAEAGSPQAELLFGKYSEIQELGEIE